MGKNSKYLYFYLTTSVYRLVLVRSSIVWSIACSLLYAYNTDDMMHVAECRGCLSVKKNKLNVPNVGHLTLSPVFSKLSNTVH